jgi:hypothetical protein
MAFGIPGFGKQKEYDLWGLKKKGGLTEYEQELRPYLISETAKKGEEAFWQQPLEALIDIVNRPSNAVINMIKEAGSDDTLKYLATNKEFLTSYFDITKNLLAAFEVTKNILAAGGRGLAGEEKGTGKTLFFGGTDIGSKQFKGLFPQEAGSSLKNRFTVPVLSSLPLIGGLFRNTTGEDLIGVIGDIFFDPLTYIGVGAAKSSKSVAPTVAKKMQEMFLKGTGNTEMLSRFTKEGFKIEKYQKMILSGSTKQVEEARKYLTQFIDKKAMNRFVSQQYSQFLKEAKIMSPEQAQVKLYEQASRGTETLAPRMAEAFRGNRKGIVKALEELKKSGEFGDPGTIEKLLESVKGANAAEGDIAKAYEYVLKEGAGHVHASDMIQLADLPLHVSAGIDDLKKAAAETAKIGSPEYLASLTGLGTKQMTLFGIPIATWQGKHVIAKSWNALSEAVGNTKIGGRLKDAVWNTLNTGLVGVVRKALGFRAPYQEMIHQIQREKDTFFEHDARHGMLQVKSLFDKVDSNLETKIFNVMVEGEKAGTENIDQLFQMSSGKYGLTPEDIVKGKEIVTGLRSISKQMHDRELRNGILSDFFVNYLPDAKNTRAYGMRRPSKVTGSAVAGFQKKKMLPREDVIKSEVAKLQWLLGIDPDVARKMVVELNWSPTNMSLREMYMQRAIAHSQAMANKNMVDQFKLFGMKLGEVQPTAFAERLTRARGGKTKVSEQAIGQFEPEAINRNKDLYTFLNRKDANLEDFGLARSSDPRLAGYWFDKNIADVINKTLSMTGSDTALQKLKQLANNTAAYWRATAVFSPGFHIRNEASNMFQGFIEHGIAWFNPMLHTDSFIASGYQLFGEDFVRKFGFAKGFIARRLDKTYGGRTLREISEEMSKKGLVTKESLAFEASAAIKSMTKKKTISQNINMLSTEALPFRAMRGLGSVLESESKLASALIDIDSMAKQSGGLATEAMMEGAAINAKKIFYDYGDLTDFEKTILKNLIPFYTWTRKNLARQVDLMLHNQTYRAAIGKILAKQLPEDYEDLPGYMEEQAWTEEGETPEGLTRMSHPNLPYEDINKLPIMVGFDENGLPRIKMSTKETWDDLISMASPVIKTIAAAMTNRDVFRKKDLSGTSPAPRVMRLFAAAPITLQTVDALLKAMGYEPGLGATIGDKGELQIDAKIQYILEANFPLIQRIDQMGDSIATVLPQIEQVSEKLTGIKTGYDEVARRMKAMSFALGITQKDIDKDKEAEYAFREVLKKAEEELQKARKTQPGYEVRQEKYLRQARKRMRRLRTISG